MVGLNRKSGKEGLRKATEATSLKPSPAQMKKIRKIVEEDRKLLDIWMVEYQDISETYIGRKGESRESMDQVPKSDHWKIPLMATLLTLIIFFTGIFLFSLFLSLVSL